MTVDAEEGVARHGLTRCSQELYRRRKAVRDRTASVLSSRGPQAHIRQLRTVLERSLHDSLDVGTVRSFEGQTRRTGERGAAAHDLFAQLDALHEVRAGIEMQERHEPFVERPRLLVPAGLRQTEQ